MIRRNGWLLIDLWARVDEEDSIYADITWTAHIGGPPTPIQQEVFGIVAKARDTGFRFLEDAVLEGRYPEGWEVDDAARRVISEAGYGDYFVHRLGHSLGREVHANGVNLDGWETRDTRRANRRRRGDDRAWHLPARIWREVRNRHLHGRGRTGHHRRGAAGSYRDRHGVTGRKRRKRVRPVTTAAVAASVMRSNAPGPGMASPVVGRIGVASGVGTGIGEGAGVGVGVGVGIGIGDGVGVGAGVGLAVGVGAGIGFDGSAARPTK